MRIDNASGYIEEQGSNKCLIFDSTDENKELLKKYSCVFNGLIDEKKKSRWWLAWIYKRLHKD